MEKKAKKRIYDATIPMGEWDLFQLNKIDVAIAGLIKQYGGESTLSVEPYSCYCYECCSCRALFINYLREENEDEKNLRELQAKIVKDEKSLKYQKTRKNKLRGQRHEINIVLQHKEKLPRELVETMEQDVASLLTKLESCIEKIATLASLIQSDRHAVNRLKKKCEFYD